MKAERKMPSNESIKLENAGENVCNAQAMKLLLFLHEIKGNLLMPLLWPLITSVEIQFPAGNPYNTARKGQMRINSNTATFGAIIKLSYATREQNFFPTLIKLFSSQLHSIHISCSMCNCFSSEQFNLTLL